MRGLKLWHWFCKLGDGRPSLRGQVRRPIIVKKQVSDEVSESGVDMVCSRICGQEGCRCGSTVRGLHCIWSYYRLENDK